MIHITINKRINKMNVEKIENDLTNTDFEEILNDMYEDVNICGYIYSQGRILREIDEIAFNEMKNNYEDSLNRDNEQWRCLECEKIYDNKEEAEKCCNDDNKDDDNDNYKYIVD